MAPPPITKIPLTISDKWLEYICLLLLAGTWALTIFFFHNLPGPIPTHYNAAGYADRFGNNLSSLMLPLIATFLYILLTVLNKYPQYYNYPAGVTNENAKKLYKSASRLVRIIKFLALLVLSGIVVLDIHTAITGSNGNRPWLLPLIITLFVLPNIFFFLRMNKKDDRSQSLIG